MSGVRSFDEASLLVDVDGAAPVADVEAFLQLRGHGLDLSAPFTGSVATWLATGAPGARSAWLDPADHLVAGFTARLADGRELEVRPAPRRAVGPDTFALFFGMGERFGAITRAWLRVHPTRAVRPTVPFAYAEPPVSDDERALWDAIARELT